MKNLMWLLKWMLKAAIFFTLFAFALNNQQDATRALVLRHPLARAAGAGACWPPLLPGVVAGRAGHGAALVEAAQAAPPVPTVSAPPARHRRRRRPHAATRPRRMDLDLTWILLGLPLAFVLGWVASRLDLRQLPHGKPAGAQGLFQGPELPAQRAAGPGHRCLHRGRAERPRHLRTAFRAGQPVSPPRRIRPRGARARTPALARRPAARPTATAPSTRWRWTSSRPACSTAPRTRCSSSKARPSRVEARLALLANYERSRDWAQAADIARKLETCGPGQLQRPPGALPVRTGRRLSGQATTAQRTALLEQAIATAPARRARAWNWPACSTAQGQAARPAPRC